MSEEPELFDWLAQLWKVVWHCPTFAGSPPAAWRQLCASFAHWERSATRASYALPTEVTSDGAVVLLEDSVSPVPLLQPAANARAMPTEEPIPSTA